MMNKNIIILFIATMLLGSYGCQDAFLKQKPDQALLVPRSLVDFQALLDNSDAVMNFCPVLTLISADDFTSLESQTSMALLNKNSYYWESDIYQGGGTSDFSIPYQQIFYANIVLDGLKKMKIEYNNFEYNRIYASALFYRAMGLYQLTMQFAPIYNKTDADKIPGLMIRTTPDINDRPQRSSIRNTFGQMIADLTNALKLSGNYEPTQKTRPGRQAILSLLSRIYLQMEDYVNALSYAEQALLINDQLMDYNTLTANITNQTNPFPIGLSNKNPEIIFYSTLLLNPYLTAASTIVSSDLQNLYEETDLRKQLLFYQKTKEQLNFKGSYSGNTTWFSGISTNELHLIKAECLSRIGNPYSALENLNILLIKRYIKDQFIPLSITNASELLNRILEERRKELIGRGMRWADLKRLNNNPQHAVNLVRSTNDKVYILKSNDPRYAFPLPDNEIIPGEIIQNPR